GGPKGFLTACARPQPGVRVVAGFLDEQVPPSRILVLPSSPFPGGTPRTVDQSRTVIRRAGRDLPEAAPASPPWRLLPDSRASHHPPFPLARLGAPTPARTASGRPGPGPSEPPWRDPPGGDRLRSGLAPLTRDRTRCRRLDTPGRKPPPVSNPSEPPAAAPR